MTTAGFRRGLVAALPFLLGNGAAGLVMGLTYRDLGWGHRTPFCSACWSTPPRREAITLSMWAHPLPIVAHGALPALPRIAFY